MSTQASRHPVPLLVLIAVSAGLALPPLPAQDSRAFRKVVEQREFARVSPFRALRRTPSGIEVQVDDARWYVLLAIDEVATGTLLQGAEKHCGRGAWERIVEDIVEVMDVVGHRPDATVALDLREVTSGRRIKMKSVRLTKDKRRRAKDAARETTRKRPRRSSAPAMLAPAAWQGDLTQLGRLLDERFVYRKLGEVDVDRELATARERLGKAAVTRDRLGQEVTRVFAAFRDGHAGVQNDVLDRGYLPFLVGETGGKLVAFHGDRSRLLSDDHPYLVGLDGRSMDQWMAAARPYVNRGSATYVRRQSLRLLRNIQFLRRTLGLEMRDELDVTLEGPGGRRDLRVKTSPRRPAYGTWPRSESRLLAGKIGYLRVPSMRSSREFLDGLDAAMASFRDTRGLVIDVRGNGGGSRAALRRLFPYVMDPKEQAVVGNVAAYRLQPGEEGPDRPEGYLENRWLYPRRWPQWSEAARAAIDACAGTFRPEWQPPAADFSAWHYMVLTRDANPKAYRYRGPVVILMNSFCFSATDIFLGAFKGRPGVTLLGTPSGGGSARTARYALDHSRLRVGMATMASFRPDGRLYDGNGIRPDVTVEPAPTDWIGKTDAVLEATLARLRR